MATEGPPIKTATWQLYLWPAVALCVVGTGGYDIAIYMFEGGGIFLLPYILSMLLICVPLMLLQLRLGSMTQRNVVQLFSKHLPVAQGLGAALLVQVAIISICQQIQLTYVLTYMFKVMGTPDGESYPWRNCDNVWNTPNCRTSDDSPYEFSYNDTYPPKTIKPTHQYFNYEVLQWDYMSGELGPVVAGLAWPLFLSCLFILALVAAGARIFPWIVAGVGGVAILLVFMFLGFVYNNFSDGSRIGWKYFFNPEWHALIMPYMWTLPISEVNTRTMATSGLLISYGKFSATNNLASYFSWAPIIFVLLVIPNIVITMVVGLMGAVAYESNSEIWTVTEGGLGFFTTTIPEALAVLHIAPWWGFVVYASGFLLAALTQGLFLLILVDAMTDWVYCERLRKILPRKMIVHLVVSVVFVFLLFLLSLPMITRGGYLLNRVITTLLYRCIVWHFILYAVSLIAVYCRMPNVITIEKVLICSFFGVVALATVLIYLSFYITSALMYKNPEDQWLLFPRKAVSLGYCAGLGPLFLCGILGLVHALVTAKGGMKERLYYVFKGDNTPDEPGGVDKNVLQMDPTTT